VRGNNKDHDETSLQENRNDFCAKSSVPVESRFLLLRNVKLSEGIEMRREMQVREPRRKRQRSVCVQELRLDRRKTEGVIRKQHKIFTV